MVGFDTGKGMSTDQALQASHCVQCHSPLPSSRTRFCSDECLAKYKREQQRAQYGHRHHYLCADCGHELHVGRHRK